MDLDLSLVEADVPNLELRRGDIVAGPVAPGDFGLVTARAVLHHVADARIAAAAEPAPRNGGSERARYWQLTIIELRDRLAGEAKLGNQLAGAFVARCPPGS